MKLINIKINLHYHFYVIYHLYHFYKFIKKDIYTLSKTSAIVAFPFWLGNFYTINGKRFRVISFVWFYCHF